jgi:hypothetical protein
MARQQDDWREVKSRCRLNDEDVAMAKELGFQPKALLRSIPSPSQPWKAPVKEWVRSLYAEKIGSRRPVAAPTQTPSPAPAPLGGERRNSADPWPDNPEIVELKPLDLDAQDPFDEFDSFEPAADDEIDEQENLLLRRQRLFRWAAQAIAVAVSEVPEVEKVAAFGAAAQPLEREVPRFREFRKHGIHILHECADLDLAIWLTDLSRLKELKRAMARGLALTQNTAWGGVANHQVDVHVFDFFSRQYRGRLCSFRQCPKAGKLDCRVPGCGAQPFLQQFRSYRFKPGLFAGEPKVILFDRSSSFLVSLPNIDVAPREVKWTPRSADQSGSDDDVPF